MFIRQKLLGSTVRPHDVPMSVDGVRRVGVVCGQHPFNDGSEGRQVVGFEWSLRERRSQTGNTEQVVGLARGQVQRLG